MMFMKTVTIAVNMRVGEIWICGTLKQRNDEALDLYPVQKSGYKAAIL
jgi:hypothetical protein